ncbi:MAG: TIGR02285 family protein [Bdellovibrio sp.]|nr:TIGR02285 family protein [Bdellovibrio sp.]
MKSWIVLLLISFFSLSAPCKVDGATIYWLFFDAPGAVNLNVHDHEAPGYLLEVHRLLVDKMPEYKHQVVEVPFLRILEQMKKKKGTCTLMIIKTPERESFMEFGTPLFKGIPAGVIASRNNAKLIRYMTKSGVVDLDMMLKDKNINVGVITERYYGKKINESLVKIHGAQLIQKRRKNAAQELKSMMAMGRLDVYLGFPFEVAFNSDFIFYPIKGNSELLQPSISCEKTAFGKAIIAKTEELRRKQGLDSEIEKIYTRYAPLGAQGRE